MNQKKKKKNSPIFIRKMNWICGKSNNTNNNQLKNWQTHQKHKTDYYNSLEHLSNEKNENEKKSFNFQILWKCLLFLSSSHLNISFFFRFKMNFSVFASSIFVQNSHILCALFYFISKFKRTFSAPKDEDNFFFCSVTPRTSPFTVSKVKKEINEQNITHHLK